MDDVFARLAKLEQKVAALEARADDFFEALKLETESTTENLRRHSEELVELHGYIIPTVRRVFPKIEDGYDEIEEVLNRLRREPPPRFRT